MNHCQRQMADNTVALKYSAANSPINHPTAVNEKIDHQEINHIISVFLGFSPTLALESWRRTSSWASWAR